MFMDHFGDRAEKLLKRACDGSSSYMSVVRKGGEVVAVKVRQPKSDKKRKTIASTLTHRGKEEFMSPPTARSSLLRKGAARLPDGAEDALVTDTSGSDDSSESGGEDDENDNSDESDEDDKGEDDNGDDSNEEV